MQARDNHDNMDSVAVHRHAAQVTTSNLKSDYKEHCFLLARSPKTPPAVLDALAQTAPPAILEKIAVNANTSPGTLARLALHFASDVRIAVAESPNTLPETMWRLAHDENPDVRYALAENHNIAWDILAHLTDDENPYVSCRARRTLERLRQEAGGNGPEIVRQKIVKLGVQPQQHLMMMPSPLGQFCALLTRLYRVSIAACF